MDEAEDAEEAAKVLEDHGGEEAAAEDSLENLEIQAEEPGRFPKAMLFLFNTQI